MELKRASRLRSWAALSLHPRLVAGSRRNRDEHRVRSKSPVARLNLVITRERPTRRGNKPGRADPGADCGLNGSDQASVVDAHGQRRGLKQGARIVVVALRGDDEGREIRLVNLLAAGVVGGHLQLQGSTQADKVHCAGGPADGHRNGTDLVAGAAAGAQEHDCNQKSG